MKDGFRIDMASVTGTPLHYFLQNTRGFASGESLRKNEMRLLAKIQVANPAGSKIGATGRPKIPTKDDAYEYLVDLSVILDEDNVPIDGRFVIVPAWFHGLLLKDDRFVKSGTMTGERRLQNGEVGEAAGFSILKSNNVPKTTGTKYKIIVGHSIATRYVEQIVDVQT